MEGDRAPGEFRVEASDRPVTRLLRQQDAAMDLVAHEQGAAREDKLGDAFEFVLPVDAAGGVVRIAEHERRGCF